MGSEQGLPVRLWHRRHPVALRLLAALIVLIVAVPAFTASELAGLRTVHVIYPRQALSLPLAAGGYSLDQDPDATGFPAARDAIAITGPAGPVRVSPVPYDLSPADFGGALLGLGTFAQAAQFRIPRPGIYRVSVTDPLAGARLFVSETYTTSAERAGPWGLAIIVALITLAAAGLQLTRRRWQSGRPPRFPHLRRVAGREATCSARPRERREALPASR